MRSWRTTTEMNGTSKKTTRGVRMRCLYVSSSLVSRRQTKTRSFPVDCTSPRKPRIIISTHDFDYVKVQASMEYMRFWSSIGFFYRYDTGCTLPVFIAEYEESRRQCASYPVATDVQVFGLYMEALSLGAFLSVPTNFCKVIPSALELNSEG